MFDKTGLSQKQWSWRLLSEMDKFDIASQEKNHFHHACLRKMTIFESPLMMEIDIWQA